MSSNASQSIFICVEKFSTLQSMVPVKQLQARLQELDHLINHPSLWSNAPKAVALLKEQSQSVELLTKLSSLKEEIALYSAFPEEADLYAEQIENISAELSSLLLKQMLSGPSDNNPAIVTISAGAGGLEAANWVTMIARMYSRWGADKGFKMELLDMKPSEEHGAICTDSITFRFEGDYAYGLLKGEAGVHRLIRNSPFNSGDARHTSFAAVAVLPDIEDTIDIKIEDKDVEITAIRGTGAGGQNQNKVSSCIRLKHIPTGIQIVSRSERDQLQNKKNAFTRLKAKLYEIELNSKNKEKDKLILSQSENAFGSQIRTYTLSPYSLVKDHRTSYEDTNTQSVLDGDIKNFIDSYLKQRR